MLCVTEQLMTPKMDNTALRWVSPVREFVARIFKFVSFRVPSYPPVSGPAFLSLPQTRHCSHANVVGDSGRVRFPEDA